MSSIVSNITQDDILDQMVPSRQRLKTIEKLREFKEIDKKTKLVHSTDFGFTKKLSMYVLPTLGNQEIIDRFEVRLSEKSINMYLKSKV